MSLTPLRARTPLVLLLCLLLAMGSAVAAAGAEASTEQVVVVDNAHPGADDANAGTEGQPVATVGRALKLAEAANAEGRAARVHIRPGIYRETLRPRSGGGRTDAPLVIEGAGADQVIVDGADVFSDWEPSGRVDGAFTAPWPHAWGLAPVPSGWDHVLAKRSDVLRRQEVVWVDGAVMRQVLTRGELTPGTFLVDESTSELTLMPPAGVAVGDSLVEVAVRDRVFEIDGWSNVTLRGITFRRAAASMQRAGVRIINAGNVLVEDVRSDWHNWSGLAVQRSQDVTLRRTALTRNGVVGLTVYRSEDVVIEDVDNSYNNTWRGHWAEYYGWESGSKIFRARGITIDGWHAVGNEAYGLWLDTDITDVVVRNSFIADNRRRGLFLEAMQGPALIQNNTICNNLQEGVLDGKANGVTLEGNRIFGNGRSQVVFSGEAGGRAFTTYDTGQRLNVRSENWTLRNNVIQGDSDSRVIGNHLNSEDWNVVRSSLRAARNLYHNAADPRPFTVSGAIVDFDGWKAQTRTDGTSGFSSSDAGLRCRAQQPPVPSVPTGSPLHGDDASGASTDEVVAAPDTPPATGAFRDVILEAAHGEAIERMAAAGVVTGHADGTYRPARSVTRAQLATLLVRQLGLTQAGEAPAFSDVPSDHTHAERITIAASHGVVTGFDDGTFRPEQALTRAQAASMLVRAFEIPGTTTEPGFTDVDGGVHAAAIAAAAEKGLVTGFADGTFRPGSALTRGQIATILDRVYG
jgi:hypothetical protein